MTVIGNMGNKYHGNKEECLFYYRFICKGIIGIVIVARFWL